MYAFHSQHSVIIYSLCHVNSNDRDRNDLQGGLPCTAQRNLHVENGGQRYTDAQNLTSFHDGRDFWQ